MRARVVEIRQVFDGAVQEISYLHLGSRQRYEVGWPQETLLVAAEDGIELRALGRTHSGQRAIGGSVTICEGEQITLEIDGCQYLISATSPAPAQDLAPRANWAERARSSASAILGSLVITPLICLIPALSLGGKSTRLPRELLQVHFEMPGSAITSNTTLPPALPVAQKSGAPAASSPAAPAVQTQKSTSQAMKARAPKKQQQKRQEQAHAEAKNDDSEQEESQQEAATSQQEQQEQSQQSQQGGKQTGRGDALSVEGAKDKQAKDKQAKDKQSAEAKTEKKAIGVSIGRAELRRQIAEQMRKSGALSVLSEREGSHVAALFHRDSLFRAIDSTGGLHARAGNLSSDAPTAMSGATSGGAAGAMSGGAMSGGAAGAMSGGAMSGGAMSGGMSGAAGAMSAAAGSSSAAPGDEWGTLTGEVGEADGFGGLGLVGTGNGAGGVGEGTIGLGNMGTIGHGSGEGDGYGYGRGAGSLGGRRAVVPDVTVGIGCPMCGHDKEMIRRVVRRHINEVRFCYERELQTHPDLAGRVTAQFTVGQDGGVLASGIAASSVGNARVDQCIAGAVARWQFAKITCNQSTLLVNYPFQLTPHGVGKRM